MSVLLSSVVRHRATCPSRMAHKTRTPTAACGVTACGLGVFSRVSPLTAHEVHIVWTAEVGEVRLPLVVSRERIAPGGQAVQLFPGGVECALDVTRIGETSGTWLTLL